MMQHGTFKAEQIWRALQDNEVSKSENFYQYVCGLGVQTFNACRIAHICALLFDWRPGMPTCVQFLVSPNPKCKRCLQGNGCAQVTHEIFVGRGMHRYAIPG